MARFDIHYCTLTLPRKDGKVLLGRKTAKIGKGLYNGPGGIIDVDKGEDASTASVRELFEETGLGAESYAIVPIAIVDCYNRHADGTPKNLTKVFVSEVYDFSGEAADSDELIEQQWFATNSLPYAEMLAGDKSWINRALSGERFIACVYYGPGMAELERETAISPMSQDLLNRLWARL